MQPNEYSANVIDSEKDTHTAKFKLSLQKKYLYSLLKQLNLWLTVNNLSELLPTTGRDLAINLKSNNTLIYEKEPCTEIIWNGTPA